MLNARAHRRAPPDVATKLNLIPPIAEQCQHQYVPRAAALWAGS